MRIRRAFALTLLFSRAAVAEEPASPVSKDRFGDPLPAGAVHRLGTVRMRLNGTIMAVAVSPDGKWVAMGGQDLKLGVWELATGKPVKLVELKRYVDSLSWSPDSTRLAWSAGTGAQVWDSRNDQVVGSPARMAVSGKKIAWSPDGKRLAAAGYRGLQYLSADLQTVEEKSPELKLESLAWAPDGKALYVGEDDGPVVALDADSGTAGKKFPGLTKSTTAVGVDPRGRWLAGASRDGTVLAWDVASGKELFRVEKLSFWPTALEVSPDGSRLAVASQMEGVRLIDTVTWKEVERFKTCPGSDGALAFTPDGRRIVAGGHSQALHIRDLESKKAVRLFPGHDGYATAAVFLKGGGVLASAGWDGAVVFWDPRDGSEKLRIEDGESMVYALAPSPDGARVVSSGTRLRVFDAGTGQVQAELPGQEKGYAQPVWSPDGKSVRAVSAKEKLLRWTPDAGDPATEIDLPGPSLSLRAIPGTGELVCGREDGHLLWFDGATGAVTRDVAAHPRWVAALAVSPDGAIVAAGGGAERVSLYNAKTGGRIRDLDGNATSAWHLAFSPDGQLLAVACQGNSVRVWETATGVLRKTFEGHTGPVTCVQFSPDGNRLASSSWDSTILVWDTSALRRKQD